MRLRGLVPALAVGVLAAFAQPALAATPPTYADASDDATRGAPELTTVIVSNDDAGTIRFRINIANQRELARDAVLELFIDADQNPATGDPLALGADYRFIVDGASQSFGFARWDGARYDPTAPSESARVWYWSGVSISINRSELGGTGAVSFWARGSGPEQASDAAPNQGTWAYQLQTGSTNPADIDAFFFRVRPAAPRAGMPWRLQVDSLKLVGSPTRVRADSWSCSATLGGKTFRGTGPGRCTFRLPRRARGKRLAVTITVGYMGEVVSGVVTYRVR